MRVIIDGVEVEDSAARISIYDWGVIRGYGVFEVIRSYDGSPFRLSAHLDRLERSAGVLGIPLPDRADLAGWVERCATEGGECQVRVVVTGGGRDPLVEAPGRTIVLWEPTPSVPDRLAVMPLRAMWHQESADSDFANVKWTSYAPNMASTDAARTAGFHDALLLGGDGTVLEGPTFTVAWLTEGRIETPALDLGILASITRDVMLEAAARLDLAVDEGVFDFDRLLAAQEAFALSTVKEVTPIDRIGDHEMAVGPVGEALAREFRSIVAFETGAGGVGA